MGSTLRSLRVSNRASLLVLLALPIGSHATGQSTTRVSVDSSGAQANGGSTWASISEDGRYVAFVSEASDLVPGDSNGQRDVFVHDRQTGAITRAHSDSSGTQANSSAMEGSISLNGRFVVYRSFASNLVSDDTNDCFDIFRQDLQTGVTQRASVSSSETQANDHSMTSCVSREGRVVAFWSRATNLVPGDTNDAYDVFVHDFSTGATTRVSVSSSGVQGNDMSNYPSISADGRFVAFATSSTNLVPGDTNGAADVFVHDLQTSSTERVSIASNGAQANGHSQSPSVSPDGRFVAFASGATNLAPGVPCCRSQIYVHDRQTGETRIATVDGTGAPADADCISPNVSDGGRFVTYFGQPTNLVPLDAPFRFQVFVHDFVTGTTRLVSQSSSATEGDDHSVIPTISADGRFVVFESEAANLVAGDTNGAIDVFVRDIGLPTVQAVCFGDGSGSVACPCGNEGAPGHGCENSESTGGAIETFAGTPSVSADTLVLTSAGERPTSLSIFLQGNLEIPETAFGDGLRCTGGNLKRLFTKEATGGVVTAPSGNDLSVTERSAALGSPISPDDTRLYQVYYRDPSATFCPSPAGNTFSASNALRILWGS